MEHKVNSVGNGESNNEEFAEIHTVDGSGKQLEEQNTFVEVRQSSNLVLFNKNLTSTFFHCDYESNFLLVATRCSLSYFFQILTSFSHKHEKYSTVLLGHNSFLLFCHNFSMKILMKQHFALIINVQPRHRQRRTTIYSSFQCIKHKAPSLLIFFLNF